MRTSEGRTGGRDAGWSPHGPSRYTRGSVTFRAAGTLGLRVKPTRAARKALRRGKRVRVTIRTAFQPAGAARVIAAERVTLTRR